MVYLIAFWASKPSRYVTSHPGQLSMAILPWVAAMSTGDGYGHHCHRKPITLQAFAMIVGSTFFQ